MAKKILVLNGSPRAKGNTSALANALIAGAESAGHSATRLDICTMKLNPCLGCYQCLAGKGNPCVQKDEMHTVYDALEAADVVVFASPLYWWHFTAQLKIVIDRIFALVSVHGVNFPQKEVAMLIAAEGDSAKNFAQIIPYFQTCLAENLHWIDRGMVLASGVNTPGDVEKTAFMDEAKKLGASL